MKLIIDIPDDRYKWIMNYPETYNSEYCKAIRNGKPYEERTQGEWEDYSVDFYKCPECGYLLNKICPQCYNKVILPKGGTE